MKTKQIQSLICKVEVLKGNLPCENVSYLFYQSEVDVLSILKSNYLVEYEVKVSRSDFLVDKKKNKWKYFDKRIEKGIPNYFYYVCPKDLIQPEEIQDYAGLIYVTEEELIQVKSAKILHRHKQNTEKLLTKIVRLKSERKYLGCSLMTYRNKEAKRIYEEKLKSKSSEKGVVKF